MSQRSASIGETRDLLESGAAFDFVVLDLALGSEDGLEVLPLIARFNPDGGGRPGLRFRRTHPEPPANASPPASALLVAGVLRKPILPTALQRTVAPGARIAVHRR